MKIRITCKGSRLLDISEMVVIQGNLKDLDKKEYLKLKNEIIEEGFSEPISIWFNNGQWKILNGTQRYRTLTQMRVEGFEIPLIPVSEIEADDEAQARRKLLAFTSNYGKMTSQGLYEFSTKSDITFDEMEKRYRFAEIPFKKFKDEFFQEPPREGEDDVPESRTTQVVIGDLFHLGQHRLLCGDSTDESQVVRLMDDERADMVFTDPPYNIAYEGKTKEKLTIQNDEMGDESFKQFLFSAYSVMNFAMKPGAPIYICHADTERVNFTYQFKQIFKLSSVIVWNKQVATFGRQDYFWKHEPILYGWKEGSAHSWHGPNNEVSVWDIDRPVKSEEHPTMKPIALIERALANSSQPGDLLLEPFSGSGSTLIACEKNGRKCYGLELDPHYCSVIIERWQKFTGKEATTFRDGKEIGYNTLKSLQSG